MRLFSAFLLLILLTGCDTLGITGSDEADVAAAPQLFPAQLDDRWGFVDATGRMAVRPQFIEAKAFGGPLAPVRTRTSYRWGYADAAGTLVVDDRYQSTRTFRDGMGGVRLDNRWGFVDASGAEVISPRFVSIDSFSEGYAFVRLADYSRAYVDRTGAAVTLPEDLPELDNHDHSDVRDGAALVRVDGEYRFLVMDGSDASGTPLFEAAFADARPFHEGVAPVRVSDRWGLIDKTGAFVVSPRWIEMGAFGEGLAPVRTDGDDWGFVDTQGRVAIAPAWDEARPFAGGRAAVRDGRRWGFAAPDGSTVIAPQFDEVRDFRGGAAQIRRFVGDDTHVGYVDEQGEWLWYPTD